MTFADTHKDFVDIDGEPWGSFRLLIGGKDVTTFRDVFAQIGGYQLTEPYSYGPADFGLPQVSMFEVDDWGTGDLWWLNMGAKVILKQVDSSGTVVRTIWRGFVSVPNVTSAGTFLHCEGEASGRLALKDMHPSLFSLKSHVGRKIYDAFNLARLNVIPYLGGDVGVKTDGRGMTGGRVLDYVDNLLAATIGTDGSQYTLTATSDSRTYELAQKDTTTVDFTAFLGAHGVDPDLQRDISEEPTTIYGSGVSPEGLVWFNEKFSGLKQAPAPDYPMTDGSSFGEGTTNADTDSGDGVTVMMQKLVGMGYLDRTKRPGGFDSDVTDALEALQDDAGLTQSGEMNPDTWDALFDLNVTGFSLKGAKVFPLAQRSAVKKWLYTANGSLAGKNPNYDPTVVEVDLTVDHGSGVEKSRARKWSKGVLHRVANSSNWAGTVTLTSDVFAGDATYGSPGMPMSRLDITAGMNMRLRNFGGNLLFHVSGVQVSSDLSVQLLVDTQARDAATVGEVIARNVESRSNPARIWLRQHKANVNMRQVEFSEVGGLIWDKVTCPANTWTVFPVVAGQAGTVARVRIQTSDSAAAFCTAIFGQRTGAPWLNQHVGNPFDTNSDGESKWSDAKVQNYLDTQRVLLGAWGDDAQPCGYYPRAHTGADGTTTDATITGLFLDDGGFDYHTFGDPVVYVAVYPDRDTVIAPQRIFWPVMETDA